MKFEALGFQSSIWLLREMLVEGFVRVGTLGKNEGRYFYDKGSGTKIGKR
jgi:hypothetical protein